ncbi:MAG: T9SS type A sorting domain-containing protein [Flavobacteriales bacterium]|nr:T9SS type A sorting domain-containing protein [Flavobacteriales bacterium]
MKALSTILLMSSALTIQAQTITSTGNFTWSPDELTVTAGTEITIIVTGNHDMREVSEATWNANGTTSNGGFEFLAGTHTLTLTTPGTYYYVCVPHISMGMKGKIIVETNTNVAETTTDDAFNVFPNPAKDEITITGAARNMVMSVVDVQGREVMHRTLQGNDRVNITQLPEGTYTLMLLNETGTLQARKQLSITR